MEPEIYQTILGHEQRLDDIPSFGLDGPTAGYLDRLHEWVDYLMERLSDDPEAEEVETVLRNAVREAEEVEQDLDEEDRIPPEALRALLTTAVDHAVHAKVRQRIDAMVYAREQFEEIEVLARVARPDAEVNVLRQGFVLLMTAFDVIFCQGCSAMSIPWTLATGFEKEPRAHLGSVKPMVTPGVTRVVSLIGCVVDTRRKG